jgi:hypothetical protein
LQGVFGCGSVPGMMRGLFILLLCSSFAAAAPKDKPATKPASRPAPHCAVFVVDHSEAMRSKLSAVRPGLCLAVRQLPEGSTFNVLLVSAGKVVPFRPQPVKPTPLLVERLSVWMSTTPAKGKASPAPGVTEAVRQKAEVVWFVTDGNMADASGVVRRLSLVAEGDDAPPVHAVIASPRAAKDKPRDAKEAEAGKELSEKLAEAGRGGEYRIDAKGVHELKPLFDIGDDFDDPDFKHEDDSR